MPRVWQWLQERDYIAGDEFTLTDIYYYQLLEWIKILGVDLPVVSIDYLKKLESREKFPKSLKNKNIDS